MPEKQRMTGLRRRGTVSAALARRRGRRGRLIDLVAAGVLLAALVLLPAAAGATAQATPATAKSRPPSPARRQGSNRASSTSSGPVRSSSSGPVVSSSSGGGGGTAATPARGGSGPALNGGPTLRPPRPSATADEAFQRARSAQSDFAFFGQYLGPPGTEPLPGGGGGGPLVPPPPTALPPLKPLGPSPTPAPPGAAPGAAATAPPAPQPPAPAPGGAAAPPACGPGQRTCGSVCCNGATERCVDGARCKPLPAPSGGVPPSGGTATPPPPPPATPAPSGGSTPPPASSPGAPPSSNPAPPPSDGGGDSPPPPPTPGSPPDAATFACGKATQCNKGQQCIVYDESTDDVECCDASAICKLDDEYTECCADDQACVVDDSDEEGKMRVCEDKKAVCGGRSDCNPDDGFVCVADKVCCMDKDEKPCDPSGVKSRVCCDQTIYDCKMEDGQFDCYDKPEAASGKRKLLGVPPAWAAPPSAAHRAEDRARRPWRTAEGHARRRAEQLARRRGQSLADPGRGFLPFRVAAAE